MYEARNRPSWLPVPLQGVRRLAATADAAGARTHVTEVRLPDTGQSTASPTRNS